MKRYTAETVCVHSMRYLNFDLCPCLFKCPVHVRVHNRYTLEFHIPPQSLSVSCSVCRLPTLSLPFPSCLNLLPLSYMYGDRRRVVYLQTLSLSLSLSLSHYQSQTNCFGHPPAQAHVYSEGGEFWDAMLNQTNLKKNNNKFYILQLLEDNSSHRYTVWFRWGRGMVGEGVCACVCVCV